MTAFQLMTPRRPAALMSQPVWDPGARALFLVTSEDYRDVHGWTWHGEARGWELTHPSLFDTTGGYVDVFAVWEPSRQKMIVGYVARTSGNGVLKLREREGPAWPDVSLPIIPAHGPMTASYADGALVNVSGHDEENVTYLITGGDMSLVARQTGGPLTIAHDEQRREVMGIGFSELWRWRGDRWESVPLSGRRPSNNALAFDHDRGQLVSVHIRELLGWDGSSWQPATPPAEAHGFHGGFAAYDPDQHVLVFAGGQDFSRSADPSRVTQVLPRAEARVHDAVVPWVAPGGLTASPGVVDGRLAFVVRQDCVAPYSLQLACLRVDTASRAAASTRSAIACSSSPRTVTPTPSRSETRDASSVLNLSSSYATASLLSRLRSSASRCCRTSSRSCRSA